jgi:hypothetical protein
MHVTTCHVAGDLRAIGTSIEGLREVNLKIARAVWGPTLHVAGDL